MRSAGLAGALHLSFLFFFLLFFWSSTAAKINKEFIKRTRFDTPLSLLQFFEDSETVLVSEPRKGIVHRSTDAGASWDQIKEIDHAMGIILNPSDNNVAIVIGGDKHWITDDQGKHWRSFKTPGMSLIKIAPFSFHATDNKKIIINAASPFKRQAYYTTDGFKSEPKVLKKGAKQCMWAKEKEQFHSGDEKIDDSRTLCVAPVEASRIGPFDLRLYASDDYFDSQEEGKIDDGRSGSGFESMVSATKYILAARQSEGTTEMAMYTTLDGKSWHRALFGQKKLEAGGYTVMESTNYSIRVDVPEGEGIEGLLAPMGALYSSNSNGTHFTKNEGHTNRNFLGFVDFEKMDNIQGVALMNIVGNKDAVFERGEEKSLETRITFDDGRSFQPLKGKRDDRRGNLHLHGYSEMRNQGRVFSNKGAPGLLMGIGNLGDDLHEYQESNLWVSSDGGVNWHFGYEGPHKYEFADSGSILAAVSDPGPTDHIKYSTDYGKTWDKQQIVEDDDDKFRPNFFTTIIDSTSTKVLLTAQSGRGDDNRHWIYSIDFKLLDLKDCGKGDFETWNAREDEDGKPGCVMGQTQSFRRRKADAKCFVDKEFKESLPESEPCPCTTDDFECATGFKRSDDRKSCLPEGVLDAPKDVCKDDDADETFEGRSGFQLIPGNVCKHNDVYEKLMKPVERSCKDASKGFSAEGIQRTVKKWNAKGFREYRYLEKPDFGDKGYEDETVLVITDEREAWKTRDHGKKWERIEELGNEQALFIYPNMHEHQDAYIVTTSKDVFYTANRGESFRSFEIATPPNDRGLPILRFHPKHRNWLIWTGCGRDNSFGHCDPVTHVSRKRGDEWEKMVNGAGVCEFVWREDRNTSTNLVFCTREEGSVRNLISSDDWFDTEKTLFDDVVNFATMSEFIIVATREDKELNSLALNASVDAKTFAPAKFPPKMSVTPREGYDGYTVLDSSSHSIFLHATINSHREREYGTIVKSNSNGTNFVTSLMGVNRNTLGYVDFEKLLAIEGAALANVVDNVGEVEQSGVAKKIKTKITHNDGADWDYIAPPSKDSEGNSYDCSYEKKKKVECSLHLHGYTERRSPDDTYSSPSAIGLVLGIGNVGPYLLPKRDGDTFVSRDGGITWHAAVKGQYMWEFGDQGSIIVLVEERSPTNKILYSLDEGQHWENFTFSEKDEEYDITDISTVPSDGSLNFLLWGRQPSGKRQAVTVNIDFSGVFDRQCELSEDNPESGDYDLWKPEHPFLDNDCLFGHQALYHRKKQTAKSRTCYNGPMIERLHNVTQDCACTHRDFECDYNFERNSDGLCIAVGEERDPIEDCYADPTLDHYYPVTGYRRIPGNSCEGGVEQEKIKDPKPCPGHEGEFQKKYGTSGWLVFFIVLICAIVAGAVGWFVYTRWGTAQFGRIHLGESGEGAAGTTTSRMRIPLDTNSPFVRYPVMGVSAAAATIMALPMIALSAARWVGDRVPGRRRTAYSRLGGGGWSGGGRTYTSRSSFARGRDWEGSAEESDLLGEESDEE